MKIFKIIYSIGITEYRLSLEAAKERMSKSLIRGSRRLECIWIESNELEKYLPLLTSSK